MLDMLMTKMLRFYNSPELHQESEENRAMAVTPYRARSWPRSHDEAVRELTQASAGTQTVWRPGLAVS